MISLLSFMIKIHLPISQTNSPGCLGARGCLTLQIPPAGSRNREQIRILRPQRSNNQRSTIKQPSNKHNKLAINHDSYLAARLLTLGPFAQPSTRICISVPQMVSGAALGSLSLVLALLFFGAMAIPHPWRGRNSCEVMSGLPPWLNWDSVALESNRYRSGNVEM